LSHCHEEDRQNPRVTAVEVLPPHGLRLTFDDGLTRDVDLADELWGPMFEPLKDPAFFAQVAVDHGTVVWPNGVDLDPLVLHGDFEASNPVSNVKPAERTPGVGREVRDTGAGWETQRSPFRVTRSRPRIARRVGSRVVHRLRGSR